MPSTAIPLRFLLSQPAHCIALGFGAGLAPAAPGTFGTLVAFPIAWALYAGGSDVLYLGVTALLFLVGIWAAGVTARDLGADDHGAIVIDEIAAFVLVLFFARHTLLLQAAAFLLFRLFDITKPPPIGIADAKVKGGFGVMLDDVLAAAYAIAVLMIIQRFAP